MPVPKIIALDTSKTMLHCNYSIMNKIEGDDLDDVWQTMNDGEKKDVCYQLGRLLAQLHAIEMKA
ncbi:TPA: phosphotransferase, partial [Candidatus Woesearchaeota archaeon]|nr:phosphotransferase [Candidatus Woesearchaeota archaeon]